MDKKTASLFKGYLAKSKEKLVVARSLLKLKDYEDAVSRAYYCVFHAAQAMLLTEGLSAHTHQGLISLFSSHFIKTGKLEKKLGKYLVELKDDRERSDYEIYSTIDKETATQSIKEADEFLKGILRHFKK